MSDPNQPAQATEQAPGIPSDEQSVDRRILYAIEHQTDQLERIADHTETIAVVLTNEQTRLEGTQTDGTSKQLASPPSNGPPDKARETLQRAMLDYGVDVSEVKLVNDRDSGVYYLRPTDEISVETGSPWREFTGDMFGDELPGSIKWAESRDGDWYPEDFMVDYDAISAFGEGGD